MLAATADTQKSPWLNTTKVGIIKVSPGLVGVCSWLRDPGSLQLVILASPAEGERGGGTLPALTRHLCSRFCQRHSLNGGLGGVLGCWVSTVAVPVLSWQGRGCCILDRPWPPAPCLPVQTLKSLCPPRERRFEIKLRLLVSQSPP